MQVSHQPTLVFDPEAALFDGTAVLVNGITQAARRQNLNLRTETVAHCLRRRSLHRCLANIGLGEAGATAILDEALMRFPAMLKGAQPHFGIRRGLHAASDQGWAIAFVSRIPHAAIMSWSAHWEIAVEPAWCACPPKLACASTRRLMLADCVRDGRVRVQSDVFISDDLQDIDLAQSLGVRTTFAAYGRTQWYRCFLGANCQIAMDGRALCPTSSAAEHRYQAH